MTTRITIGLAFLMSCFLLYSFAHADEPLSILYFSASETHIAPDSPTSVRKSVVVAADYNARVPNTLSIQDEHGVEVRRIDFTTQYPQYEWDGKNESSEVVPDGVYTFVFHSGEVRNDSLSVVVDTVPPVVTLNGEATVTHLLGTNWIEPGATTNEGLISIQHTVHVNRLGTSTLNYVAVDEAGNTTTVTRTVLVVEALPEVATTSPITTTHTERSQIERYIVTVPEKVETEVERVVETVRRFTLDIEGLQRALIRTGFLAIDAPTGIFGPLTHTAVRFYQLANGLPETGFVDEETLSAIEQEETSGTLASTLEQILFDVEQVLLNMKN